MISQANFTRDFRVDLINTEQIPKAILEEIPEDIPEEITYGFPSEA